MTPLGFIITVVLMVLAFLDVVDLTFWQLMIPLTIGVSIDLFLAIIALAWQIYFLSRFK